MFSYPLGKPILEIQKLTLFNTVPLEVSCIFLRSSVSGRGGGTIPFPQPGLSGEGAVRAGLPLLWRRSCAKGNQKSLFT